MVTFGSLGHVELHGTLHATAMPPSGNREDDRVDVAALELSPAEVAAIDDAHFLSLEDLDLRDHSAARRPYVLIGFPGAKQRRQLPDTAFKMEIIPYTSFEADVSDYDNVGLNRDGHLLIKFDKKNSRGTDGKVATPPDPQGESGGGIWRIDDVTSPISESTSIPLVGIFIEHQPRKAKALIATRIQFHLALLKTVRPDLQSYLPDLPSMTETPIYSGQIPPVAT